MACFIFHYSECLFNTFIFLDKDYIFCDGIKYKKYTQNEIDGKQQCCGNRTISSQTQICCTMEDKQKIFTISKELRGTIACCGLEAYSMMDKRCVEGKIVNPVENVCGVEKKVYTDDEYRCCKSSYFFFQVIFKIKYNFSYSFL